MRARKTKITCRGCGAEIRYDTETCPYCGYPHSQHRPDRIGDLQESRERFAVDRESGTIEFGDGKHGRRPSTGSDNARAAYRAGGGSGRTTKPARTEEGLRVVKCSACGTENPLGHKICNNCSAKL
ncbi:MAG: hypothetical protein ACXABV_09425 [Candidatus Thorarchaeota archaeon]|jgi:ribosomal protein L37E